MSKYEKLLLDHGIAPTPQRLDVARIVLARPQHLSADQVLEVAKRRRGTVSKATVYNTLQLFTERGLVREITVDSSRRYYDSTTRPHHHFFNVDTGEIIDIDAADVAFAHLPPLPVRTDEASVEVVIRVRNRRPADA